MSIEGQGHYLTLAQGRVHTKIQTGFSQKLRCLSKPYFVCKLSGIEGQGHFLTLAQVEYIKIFKPDFLRNYFADLYQFFNESFQVQGNENLMR